MLCFVPVLLGYVFCYVRKKTLYSVVAITEKRDMGIYEVPWSVYLLGFGMWNMLANFHMCGIMLVLRAIFNILVRNASPGGPMCFRGLMSNMSGTCELYHTVLLRLGPELC